MHSPLNKSSVSSVLGMQICRNDTIFRLWLHLQVLLFYTSSRSSNGTDSCLSFSASVDFAWITNLVAYYRPNLAPEIRLPFSCRCLTTQLHVAEKFCGIDTRSINSPLKQHNFPENHYAVVDALRQAWIYLTLKSILREFKLNNAILRYRIDEDQDALFEEDLDHSLPQQQQQQLMVPSEFWVQ